MYLPESVTTALREAWSHLDPTLNEHLAKQRRVRIEGYRSNSSDVIEHFAIEQRMREGGYTGRALYELVQNAADAIAEGGGSGRVAVRLERDRLVVANTGAPLDAEGIEAILHSHIPRKRGDQIGRFGLGFKSILQYTNRPMMLSRSACLAFDEDRVRALFETHGIAPPHGRVPVLRFAFAVDPMEVFRKSRPLADLGVWATTLVVVPFSEEGAAEAYEEVGRAMRKFPPEFLLFGTADIELTFEDVPADWQRRLQRSRAPGETVCLRDGDDKRTWHVFERVLALPPELKKPAGELFARATIPIAWAAPAYDPKGSPPTGQFWAFFPLSHHAGVPGILNAPWKTNDDRSGLLENPYNTWLFKTFADLLAESIPKLQHAGDPGCVADYLPRRELANTFASSFTTTLWQRLAETAVVPDGNGKLRQVTALRLPPEEIDENSILAAWMEAADEDTRAKFVHPSIALHRERAARIRQLYRTRCTGAREFPRDDIPSWFARVATADVDGSKRALGLARRWLGQRSAGHRERALEALRSARIVLADDDRLWRASDAATCAFFLRVPQRLRAKCRTVHPALVADEVLAEFLRDDLGIPRGDEHDLARGLVHEARRRIDQWLGRRRRNHGAGDDFAAQLWQWLDELGPELARELIDNLGAHKDRLPVRTAAGHWQEAADVLLPGAIIPGDVVQAPSRLFAVAPDSTTARIDANEERFVSTPDGITARTGPLKTPAGASPALARHVADVQGTHRHHLKLLRAAGVSESPRIIYPEVNWKEYGPWSDTCPPGVAPDVWHTLCDYVWEMRSKAQRYCYEQMECEPQAHKLIPEGRLAVLRPVWLLAEAPHDVRTEVTRWGVAQPALVQETPFVHSGTRRDFYGQAPVPSCLLWMLRKHGVFEVEGVMLPFRDFETAYARFGDDAGWFQRFAAHAGIALDNWPQAQAHANGDLDEALWLAAQRVAKAHPEEPWAAMYAAMVRDGHVPDVVAVGGKSVELVDLLVTTDAAFGEDAAAQGLTVLVVDDEAIANVLVEHGATYTDLAEAMREPRPRGDAASLRDLFDDFLPDEPWAKDDGLPLIQPADLAVHVEGRSWTMDFHLSGNTLYVSQEALDTDPQDLLVGILRYLARQGRVDAKAIEDVEAYAARRKRRDAVADCESIEDKLLAIVRGDARCLRERLPEHAARLLPHDADPHDVARVFHAAFGSMVLEKLDDVMREHGFAPPSRWNGSEEARTFVEDLYMPEAYAGLPPRRLASWGEVVARGPLPDLHDFQREVLDALRGVLHGPAPRRAMVSLPTGAGKTRIAVDLLIDEVLGRKRDALVLWVAQQEELCEQAVQAFAHAWSHSVGLRGRRLAYSRLWGGRGRSVRPRPGQPHLVVATVQSLHPRVEQKRWSWLRKADVIVIDEAHRGLAPTYTKFLDLLTAPDASWALIGLTATPFRGMDDAETVRLRRRFGDRLVPAKARDRALYQELEAGGYLARIRHETLHDGTPFDFDERELLYLQRFHFGKMPKSALERLAANGSRNERIVDRIASMPDGHKVLLFACTVEHAHELAVRLTLRGRSAAAITGTTSKSARRHALDAFLHGDLQTLVNVNVLTTGFDAPKVDAIVIARPTFSPVLYMQMVGRGLRGPRNGGKPECLLVDVKDNFARFGDRLATYEQLVRPWREVAQG